MREGVDNLKINISGDEFCRPGQSERITYFDAEVAAAVEVAREAGVNIITHARADKAVRLALKHGIDIIYHADYATDKTLDMLEAKKKDIYLAPAVGIVYTFAHEAAEWGITREVAESYNMFYKMEPHGPHLPGGAQARHSGHAGRRLRLRLEPRSAPMPATWSTSSICSATRRQRH